MFKLFIFFCLVAFSLAQTGDDAKREERVFNQWLKKYKLDVKPTDDINKWKAEVIKKFKDAEAHNAKFRKGERKFRKAINHLSHLSDDERKATLMGFEAQPENPGTTVDKVDKSLVKDFPDYFNWADHGIVHPAGNQNPCGSCYIFASIAAIEGHACLYGNQCEKLSEQEALDCSYGRGCSGGWAPIVYNYTIDAGGAASEKDYPYNKTPAPTCDTSKRPRVKRTKAVDWKWMPNDADTIRFYLKTVGPMFMAFSYYDTMENYQDGIMDDQSGKVLGGHAVLLTGWGTENGTDYWILRNSWGPTWGEQGYFRMLRGINFANCESQWPTYPVLEK